MFPIDVLMFSEYRTMINHLSETLMLNDIQITSDYISRWVVLKRIVGTVRSQRVLKVLVYVNVLQWFFVVEHFTANAVSVAI
jgi:LEA14-like dessication related protein